MGFSLPADAAEAGYRLAAFDTIGSTSAEGLARARAGEAGPTWFVTDHQSAGTGRRGSPWQTPRGNLAASLLLTTDLPPATIATLGFAAGLALAQALDAYSPSRERQPCFTLKWPNDVLADGAKLAGILLQTELRPARPGLRGDERQRAVVIGIGVNVAASPDGLPYAAASLRGLGVEADAPVLFAALASAWVETYRSWNEGRGFGLIRDAWLARAAGLGDTVAIRSGDHVRRGVFETIDEHGHLVLRGTDGGARRISAGEVHFGRAATAARPSATAA